ncbi:hypothetical protein FHN55_20500 [Streptomyces sp. NP160]|uniref:hypothetical protein n=1 Tax=Streptomyces sp. NP160 TaxID=2586637 RepID=UPI00111B052D|nr:hypothetical protein [Streptomyces sp. NP160]TNM59559.1 hypothetical protein FHN55_20500 [Streptomyces sp. NP160]
MLRTSWRAGHVLLAVGLGWWLVDEVLTTALPGAWGGPNIGGGLLLLLATAVGGLGLVAVLLSGAGLDRRRPRWWLPVAANAALALVVVAARIVLPGDSGPGGWDSGLNGVTGVAVDDTGSPVLALAVCYGSVDTVSVYGPNRGDRPDEPLLELRTDEPVTTSALVDLADPGPRWTCGDASALRLDQQELVIATAQGDRYGLAQVAFSAEQLAALRPGEVRRDANGPSSGSQAPLTVPAAEFRDAVCGGPAD